MKSLLYIVAGLLLLISCRTGKEIVEVPIETIKTEYVYNTKLDSVFIKDSIDRWVKGDTVFIYKEHTKYKYLNKTDTIVKVDSIPKIIKIETVEEVEVNHIRWYQKLLMWLGGITSLTLIGFVIYKLKFKLWI